MPPTALTLATASRFCDETVRTAAGWTRQRRLHQAKRFVRRA
jgi:hypothetical protein